MVYGIVYLSFFVLLQSSVTLAHVSLTFPPARKYALDFMDNLNSPAPCGMPKGSGGPVTKLKAGSTIDVTWIYTEHDSGYKIELRNNVDNTAETLFDWKNETYVEKQTVTIPNKACSDCTIRVLVAAYEYQCGNRMFWSCADVNIVTESVNCYDRGVETNGVCTCSEDFYGSNCQYKYECTKNTDCNNHGECVDVGSDSRPKVCFCDMGWYGVTCEYESPVKTKVKDFGIYFGEELGHGFYMYHRILEETKEVEVVLKVEAESWVGVGWRPLNFKSGCLLYPELPNLGSITPFTTPTEKCSNGLRKPGDKGAYPDKSLTDTTGEKAHDMACLDIVIGSARGDRSRIGDHYTRLLDTPRRDAFFGGTESLTAAVGYEENGKTIILFRKKLEATERSDHSITKEPMLVSWARGQVSKPDDARKFYKKYDLKYHGGDNRGDTHYDFYRELRLSSAESGRFSGRNGGQIVEWYYLPESDEIEFTLTIENLDRDAWYGIGFNTADREMINSDVIIYSYNSRPTLTDRYVKAYGSPPIDEIQDISIQKETHINNKAIIVFRRKRRTGNADDARLDQCAYYIFAEGLKYKDTDNTISKHKITPYVTPSLVCIGPYVGGDGADFDRKKWPIVNYVIIGAAIAVGVLLFIGVSFIICRKNRNKDDEISVIDTSF